VARDKSPVLHYGCYAVDTVAKTICRDGVNKGLRPRELELAAFMFRNLDRLMSRQHLLLTVWHTSAALETRSVDTHMWRLRAALELHGTHGYKLGSVYNRGYRLETCSHVSPHAPAGLPA
jgi:DNA-binding response OmpR family regulator